MQVKNLAKTIKNVVCGTRGVHFHDTGCAEELIYPEENFSLPEFLDIEGKPHRFFEAYETTIPPFYVRSLKNGMCYTSGEEVYASDGRAILDYRFQRTPPPARWRRFLRDATRVRGKVAHLGVLRSENSYYCWMSEYLGLLHLIRKSGFRPDFYVVTNVLDFQKQWLELFGIQERQIISTYTGVSIQADELIVPSLISNWEIIKFRGHLWFQKKWLPHWLGDMYQEFSAGREKRRKRIYISRAKASYRKIVNEDSLLPLLDKYGFTVIYSENLSVWEQIEVFANANAVVGPHGAGLSNCVFCPPYTPVLEIFSQHHHSNGYRLLFAATNLRHFYMIGETPDTSCPPIQENIYVDPEKFEMALKTLLS
jgi:capsular polysaccharide biosynthesis protein